MAHLVQNAELRQVEICANNAGIIRYPGNTHTDGNVHLLNR